MLKMVLLMHQCLLMILISTLITLKPCLPEKNMILNHPAHQMILMVKSKVLMLRQGERKGKRKKKRKKQELPKENQKDQKEKEKRRNRKNQNWLVNPRAAKRESKGPKRERKEKKQKKSKLAGQPKRSMSSYMLWMNANRDKIKKDNP